MFPIFFLLLCITFPIVLFLTRTKPQEKATRERMDKLVALRGKTEAENEEVLTVKLRPVRGVGDGMSSWMMKYRFGIALDKKLKAAGSKRTPAQFVLISIGAAIGAAVAANMFLGVLPITGIAFAAGAGASYSWLKWRGTRRLNKFNEALPDSIELMSRALKAGHSMASAIEVVAQQSPEPLGNEFAKCAQQQRFGIPFRDVLLTMSDEIPSQDLHFLITAILVQKETGGDLTDILDRTTAVIRDRVRIQGEIRTHTAQGRLTGWILSALPCVLLGVTSITSPQYTHGMFIDPLGQKMLYAAAGLIVVGSLIIRKIIDIKV